jgi:phthalate 4,5-dioxygenase oxygenase subunit
MQAAQNELITRIGPGTACGALMRRYWQPVALLDEFDPRLDPRMAERPLKAVRLLGQDLVLFRDAAGTFGLLDRDCPHRGADLAFARHESDGIRCPFHGWKFAADGHCLDTPAEPAGSTLCQARAPAQLPLAGGGRRALCLPGRRGQHAARCCRRWTVLRRRPATALPSRACGTATGCRPLKWAWTRRMRPSCTASCLTNRCEGAYGRQFRSASVGEVQGERWPMTRVLREFCSPEIRHEELAPGLTRITSLRAINDALTHVRVTNAIFPHTFVIPLSETLTITQMHVPVDDTHTYWVSFFTSFAEPLDKETMRQQRLAHVTLPDYVPVKGRHNDWGYSAEEQRNRTYLGMGEDDINVHDQWAVESMGAIQDRTREHLGTSDKVIMANRRTLLQAIETVRCRRHAADGADGR